MQISADVYNRDIQVIRSAQGLAVGEAIQAAVAADVYPGIAQAASAMGGLAPTVYRPDRERAVI